LSATPCIANNSFYFCTPNRQPGVGIQPKRKLQPKIEKVRNSAGSGFVLLPAPLRQTLQNKIRSSLAEVEESFLPLHPASTGGGQKLKSEAERDKKKLSLSLAKQKNSAYLCTPKSKEAGREASNIGPQRPQDQANWARYTFFE
jgi:hypothetical protein